MRLVILTFTTLSVFLMGIFTVKMWGQTQSYVPFDHQLLHRTGPISFVIIDKKQDIDDLNADLNKPVSVLSIKMTSDGHVFILSDATWDIFKDSDKTKTLSEKAKLPKNKVQYLTAQELLDVSPDIHTLETYLQSYPQQDFVLLLSDNLENIHLKVTDIIKKIRPKGSFAFASNIDGVLKSIKEIKPLDAYSLSQSEIVRLLSFESIGLIASLQISGDFIFSPLSWKNRPLINQGLSDEIHRRYKKIYLGPLVNEEQVRQAQGLAADGFIFANLKDYRNLKNLIHSK